jgi:hypothetical protein
MKPLQRATFVKLQQGWLPTNKRLNKIDPNQSPLCPICSRARESQNHLYRCQDHRAISVRTQALNTLRSRLNSHRIPPSVSNAIYAGMQFLSRDAPEPNPLDHASSIRSFIALQNDAHWIFLLYGYIPTILFNSLTYTPKLSRRKWVSNLISALYEYHTTIWTERNQITHSTTSSQSDYVHHNLLTSAQSWYQRTHELTPAGRSLLPSSPDLLQNYSRQALAELVVQLNSFHALWARQPPITQDIRRFFLPINR